MLAVVGTHGSAHHGKDGFGIRDQLHLRMHADQERPQVLRRPVAVGRQELQVVLYTGRAHLEEEFLRRAGHAQEIGGPFHAGGVLVRPEQGDAAVLLAEGLQPFEAGNRVMEDLGEGVKGKGKGFRGLERRPLSVFVVGKDDGSGAIGVEAQGIPVYAIHDRM